MLNNLFQFSDTQYSFKTITFIERENCRVSIEFIIQPRVVFKLSKGLINISMSGCHCQVRMRNACFVVIQQTILIITASLISRLLQVVCQLSFNNSSLTRLNISSIQHEMAFPTLLQLFATDEYFNGPSLWEKGITSFLYNYIKSAGNMLT